MVISCCPLDSIYVAMYSSNIMHYLSKHIATFHILLANYYTEKLAYWYTIKN